MDIERANEILNQYYSNERLREIRRAKGFDASETDTIRMHEYIAELLRKEASSTNDDEEAKNLIDAARCFEELAKTEWRNKFQRRNSI